MFGDQLGKTGRGPHVIDDRAALIISSPGGAHGPSACGEGRAPPSARGDKGTLDSGIFLNCGKMYIT